MNAQMLLTNLRSLVAKAEGAEVVQSPANLLKDAADKVAACAAEGAEPTVISKNAGGAAVLLMKLASVMAPVPERVTKAELDAYTATKVTLNGLSDCVWKMQDAFRDFEPEEFTNHVTRLKAAIDNVAGMAAEAFGAAAKTPEAAPAAAPAAPAAPAPAKPGVPPFAKMQKGTDMEAVTLEQFITRVETETNAAVAASDVSKLQLLAKAVTLAKAAYDGQPGNSLPGETVEEFFKGSGGSGAKTGDTTAKTDQSTKDDKVQGMDSTDGDSSFAENASQVLKSLEGIIAGLPAPARPGGVIPEPVAAEFVWPMDLAAQASTPTPEPIQKSENAWGSDPWAAHTNAFDAVRR